MRAFGFFAGLLTPLLSGPVSACGLALVLAVDVSGSVDTREYRIQMDGLAAALRDGVVADALVSQQAQVTLIQWTGSSRQRQTIPWRAMTSLADVLNMADEIENDLRRWRNFSTAIGEAVALSIDVFDAVPSCARRVIDVSGDGVSNEGDPPVSMRPALAEKQVVVNALAIETDSTDLTAYFFENLIFGEGAFVITANGFEDYPAQIRRKLQRETTKQLSMLGTE
ncbi:DUF1194 domain-containing protein [Sulfitobacter aestuariivivens]|uniref:DUF1194 domain-containing protein n=1 Tax=Sulfitobacter aestuariivivens TaxID=2766981 RepID=A0A927HG86_9RHOB|nr:DUF1194 domain-containing protein [Sulfitobacter aestuariivivens]MBD3664000.1 DUF1194 domain-containing protein [Sulfitobacter aestuariivivens]